MELDDFKTSWATLDARMSSMETMVRRDQTARRTRALQAPLRWLGLGQTLEILVWIVVIGVAAPFWVAHRAVPHLLVAGLVLHVYGVLVIGGAVMQLLLLDRTYHTTPVLLFQKRIAELRRFRIINALAMGLPWLILWVPMMMVVAKGWLGVDLHAISPEWIWSSVAFGAVAMAVCVWAARRISRRPVQSQWIQSLMDDLGGQSLAKVARELDEIAAFRSE